MSHSAQRKTILILALATSLTLALIAIVANEELRQKLGTAYWVVGLSIVGCILLVLAGYVWDRTLIQRIKALHEIAAKQKADADDIAVVDDPDEVIGLARKIERMAQSLQKVEASYRGIVEDQADLICRYRGDGKLTFVNGAYARFFGRKRQELLGDAFPLFHLGLAARPGEGAESGDATSFETALENAEGAQLWFLWTQRALRNADGDVLEYQAVGHDISLRKEAEAALVHAKESAEAADRAKSEFLAMVSHEIRTPINGLVGFAALLRETPLTEEQSEHVEMIRASAENLESLIADILDLSKIEAGKLDIEHQPFALHKSVEDVCAFFAQKARAAALRLEARIEPDVPAIVTGDPGRLRQVLVNLVGNAIKFTDRGSVVLRVSCVRTDPFPGSANPATRIFFAVTDTGIGIPENKLGELFKPFSQVDASHARRRGGTGLGLIISKRLCELMGGAISVDSRVGEGSTFRFSIVAEYEKRDEPAPAPQRTTTR